MATYGATSVLQVLPEHAGDHAAVKSTLEYNKKHHLSFHMCVSPSKYKQSRCGGEHGRKDLPYS